MDSATVEYYCPKLYKKIAYGQGKITDEEALLKFEDRNKKDQELNNY